MIGNECCPPCPSVSVNVPGAPGTDGTPGAAGVNAFTLTTADFVLPAAAANVTVAVADSTFMGIGQNIFISDGTELANFQVVTLPSPSSVQLKFLDYTGDSATGVTITSGAIATPAGLQGTSPSTPISIANGGTGSATKAAAQTALGLGRNALISNSSGLSQTVTNSYVEVGTCDVTVASVGEYLLMATATVSLNGVTFAGSRTISLKIRNITQGVDICSAAFPTEILTTTSIPSFSMAVPFQIDGTAVAADHYQLLITIDTVNSAGTLNVTAGSLCVIPLRLS